MSKQNCWEFKKCGRQPQGPKAHELGVCNATQEIRLDGVHDGVNAGRACWVVAGTLCGGNVQGTFAAKMANCKQCDFYKSVQNEEASFKFSTELLTLLK